MIRIAQLTVTSTNNITIERKLNEFIDANDINENGIISVQYNKDFSQDITRIMITARG